MTDLVTLMQQALIERLNTDATREKIEKAADELIDDAIRETFKSYGDVGKKLKEVLVATIIPTGDLDDFPRLNAVYARHFGEHRPARSTVQVARLPRDARVEIEAIVRLPG